MSQYVFRSAQGEDTLSQNELLPESSCAPLHERGRILLQLLSDRAVIRIICAPALYGKSVAAYQYVQVAFAGKQVAWVNARSPHFVVDLDTNELTSKLNEADQRYELVVFDAVDTLNEQRLKIFFSAVEAMRALGTEVLITTRDRTLVARCELPYLLVEACNLLLDDTELSECGAMPLLSADLSESASSRSLGHVKSLSLSDPTWSGDVLSASLSYTSYATSGCVPVLVYDHDRGAHRFCEALMRTKPTSPEEALALIALIMVRGSLRGLDALVSGGAACHARAVAQAFPHAGVCRRGVTFEALRLSFDRRLALLQAHLDELVQQSACADECSYLEALVDALLTQGDCAFAYQVLTAFCDEETAQAFCEERDFTLDVLACCLESEGDDFWEFGEGDSSQLEEDTSSELGESSFLESEKGHLASSDPDVIQEGNTEIKGTESGYREQSCTRPNSSDWGPAEWGYAEQDQAHQCHIEQRYAIYERELPSALRTDSGLLLHAEHDSTHGLEDGPIIAVDQLTGNTAPAGNVVLANRIASNPAFTNQMVGGFALANQPANHAISASNRTFVEHTTLTGDRLHIRLFGGFDLHHGGKRIPSTGDVRQKAKLLIALLVINRNKELPRFWIERIMWPDADEKHARSSFYNLWSYIRHLLADREGANDRLCRSRDTVLLRDVRLESDVIEVEQLCAQIAHRCNADQCRLALRRIEELYRGSLLPGIENAQLEAYRSTYETKVLDAVVQGIDILSKQGDLRSALHYSSYAFALDPTREDVCYLFMTIQKRLGQFTGAMSTFMGCRKALVDRFGVDGSRRLDALYEEILHEVS